MREGTSSEKLSVFRACVSMKPTHTQRRASRPFSVESHRVPVVGSIVSVAMGDTALLCWLKLPRALSYGPTLRSGHLDTCSKDFSTSQPKAELGFLREDERKP